MTHSTYDRAVLHAFDAYQSHTRGVWDDPNILGYLVACCDDSEHSRGWLHGLCLAAKHQINMRSLCMELS